MKNPGPKVLIIDDDKQIRTFLRICLCAHGYEIIEAENAKKGLDFAAVETPDLIILDLGLPDGNGAELLTQIRQWTLTPVLILSARDSNAEKVALLDAGANDYITKPFNTPEFLARVRAALRHVFAEEGKEAVMHFLHITVDLAHRRVYSRGEKLSLTRKEYDIIRILSSNAGNVVTHQHLLTEVWGTVYKEHVEYLRTYIVQLRRKVENDPSKPQIIRTELGIGYQFCEQTPQCVPQQEAAQTDTAST